MADAVGTTHHVKVGDDLLLLRQGTYVKRAAPLFGARFTTGDPDYNNLSFWQHWAQSCWIGGMGAEAWLDDAMYDQGVGVDVSTHEVAVLSRDLGRPVAKNYDLSGSDTIREFVVFNEKLYCLEKNTAGNCKLFVYTVGTDTWTNVKNFTQSIRGMCSFSDKLWFGDGGADLTFMRADETFGTEPKPSGRTEVPYVMKVFRGKMYVGFGRHLWRMKGTEDWDGSTEFFDMVGIDRLNAMELHQGFLYMASNNGHILRTDGNVTMDLWSWDGGVVPESMRTYDGKLFVGTNEARIDGSGTEGVLYQFTGSAVTELKRWGKAAKHCNIGKLRVGARHLFYGAGSLLGIGGGFGVAVYDAVEDAHCVFASNRDTGTYASGSNGVKHIVDDLIFFGGYLWVSTRGHGLFKTKVEFRDATDYLATYDTTAAGADPGSTNGGWLTSSEFDAGTPGLRKLWRRVVVDVDVPTEDTSVTIDYSLDGGLNWVLLGTVDGDDATGRRTVAFHLDNVTGTRFKYRLTLRTTDSTRTPAVRGVVVSYLPQGDPNWQWEFMVVLAKDVELLDGSEREQDVAAIAERLEAAYRAQGLVTFIDVDGTQWSTSQPGVMISDFQKMLRFIGPSADGAMEGDIRITLLEAVEQET